MHYCHDVNFIFCVLESKTSFEDVLPKCRRLLLVLSPDYVTRTWPKMERILLEQGIFRKNFPRVVGLVHRSLNDLEIRPASTLRRIIVRNKCVHWPTSRQQTTQGRVLKPVTQDTDVNDVGGDLNAENHEKSNLFNELNQDWMKTKLRELVAVFWEQLDILLQVGHRNQTLAVEKVRETGIDNLSDRQNSDTTLPSTSSESRELIVATNAQSSAPSLENCQRRQDLNPERIIQVVHPWPRDNFSDLKTTNDNRKAVPKHGDDVISRDVIKAEVSGKACTRNELAVP